MKINKKIDLAILILFPVIIAVMAAILKTNFLNGLPHEFEHQFDAVLL